MKFQVLFVALLAVSGSFAQNNTLGDMFLVFQGFVNGLGTDIDLSEFQECMHEADELFVDFEVVVADFEKNTVESVWNAIETVTNALQYLPQIMSTCQAAEQEVVHLANTIASFGNPWSFIFDLSKHIIINHQDITADVLGACQSWRNMSYQNFGFEIGAAVGLAIFGFPGNPEVTPADVPLILEGVLIGIGAETNYTEIAQCVNSSNQLAENLTIATKDILSQTYQGVLNGIILLAETLEVLPTGIQQCNASIQDFGNLINVLSQFKTPKSFVFNAGKNILLNGVNIYNDIEDGLADYLQGSWEGFGESVGDALALVLFGSNTTVSISSDETNIIDFAYGVLEGVTKAAVGNFNQIQACLNTDEQILLLLEEAYNNITQETPASVLKGIVAIGEAAQIIPNAIQSCNQTITDLYVLVKAIESFSSPVSFAYHVGVSLLLNGKEIYDEITGAVAQYKAQNWTGFGYYVGEAFATVVLGADQLMSETYAKFLNERVAWNVAIPVIFEGMTVEEISQAYLITPLKQKEFVFDYSNSGVIVPASYDARGLVQKITGKEVGLANIRSIQIEILNNGIAFAGMDVYEDFLYYNGGIYTHSSGAFIGGLPVKIVGWGEGYWIVQNSWSNIWGEQGYFRIAFGEVRIDSLGAGSL